MPKTPPPRAGHTDATNDCAPTGQGHGRLILISAAAIALAAGVAYHNSLSGAFVFDDETAILANPSISGLADALNPPATAGTGGRPLLNLTFALNHAIDGFNVRGYHLLNLAIHIAAALTLFGVIRRTLLRAGAATASTKEALSLALATAGLWVIHPLTTASVTYISQRAESLMALFYLMALYSFIRGVECSRPARWFALSWASCLLGMATKEVMVTAPLVILAYDRFFVGGSWREALGRRPAYYCGLAATWILLAFLMRDVATRQVGFDQGVSAATYAWTEGAALARYLLLSIWPYPQILDYGPIFNPPLVWTTLSALALGGLLLAVGLLWRRGARSAFLGITCFAILLPTSSVVPVALQPVAENRTYLPLAAVLTAVVLLFHRWLGRRSPLVFAMAAVALIFLTMARNEDYRSAVVLWTDTTAKAPLNPRAERNLGYELSKIGRHEEALAHYRRAVQLLERGTGLSLETDNHLRAQAYNDVASELMTLGRGSEAVPYLELSLSNRRDFPPAQINLTKLLIAGNRADEALTRAKAFLDAQPASPQAHFACATALMALNKVDEAIAHLDSALRLDPNYIDARMQRGDILFYGGKPAEAVPHYEAVLRVRAGDAVASQMLSQSLVASGKPEAAITFLRQGVNQRPDRGAALGDLGIALFELGRLDEALATLRQAVELQPELSIVRFHLGMALGQADQWEAAATQFEAILKDMPDNALARLNFAMALANSGRKAQAIRELETVLAQHPDNKQARELLGVLRTTG